jgi:hypothetical protein
MLQVLILARSKQMLNLDALYQKGYQLAPYQEPLLDFYRRAFKRTTFAEDTAIDLQDMPAPWPALVAALDDAYLQNLKPLYESSDPGAGCNRLRFRSVAAAHAPFHYGAFRPLIVAVVPLSKQMCPLPFQVRNCLTHETCDLMIQSGNVLFLEGQTPLFEYQCTAKDDASGFVLEVMFSIPDFTDILGC